MDTSSAPADGELRLLIITDNHFDLTWRRCAWRRLSDRGRSFASYAELQTWYVEDNLALAAAHPEYRFDIESPAVVANVIDRRPDLLPRLRELAAAGRLGVPGTGWCIVDANLAAGETLVRNFAIGQAWTRRHLGIVPRLARRIDAFGNSAQLPQILRGCGFSGVSGLTYSPCRGAWWRGLDGTAIPVVHAPEVAWGGGYGKLRPCPACAGAGCAACAGRGVDPSAATAALPSLADADLSRRTGIAVVRIMPEEELPNPGIAAWAAAQRPRAVFAIEEDLLACHPGGEPAFGDEHPDVELNPNNSGCWTTRIRLKQGLRANEDAVRAAETWAALSGVPAPELAGAWQDLCFAAFHDAVTGTLVDAAADELMEVHARIAGAAAAVARRALPGDGGAGCTVANHLGAPAALLARLPEGMAGAATADGRPVPVVPGIDGPRALVRVPALAVVRLLPAAAPAIAEGPPADIASDRFAIRIDAEGIVAIRDLRSGRAISQRRDGISPAQLILEHDQGSPWATLTPPQGCQPLDLRPDGCASGPGWRRLRLRTRDRWGRFMGAASAKRSVSATVEILLIDGHDRIEIATRVDWDVHDLRLRLAFPLPFAGGAWYGIPYGMLPRRTYAPRWAWDGADGDWPGLGWAGVQGDGISVALLERGTPAFRIGARDLSVTLLRAPAQPTYLHEPDSYVMTGWDGMRDAGTHVFHHALVAYDRPFAASAVAADAEAFACAPIAAAGAAALPPAPAIDGDGVQLGALWRCDDGAIALRLVERRGRAVSARIGLPPAVRAVRRTGMDACGGSAVAILGAGEARHAVLALRPHEIATIALDG